MYDYDNYISDGLGQGYEGVGLGMVAGAKYLLLWITFIVLSTIIVNILIAVISDGFEIHKDKQRLRTKSDETFIVYAFHRLIYLTCFQFFPCCKKKHFGLKKMRFASSKHAKILLKYTDSLPDGMVFDQKLQTKVLQRIIGQEDNNSTGKRAMRALSEQSLYQSRTLPKRMLLTQTKLYHTKQPMNFFQIYNLKNLYDKSLMPYLISLMQKQKKSF